MFCPNCKDEFRAGFTRCGRCNVDLVESLADAPAAEAEPPPPVPLRLMDYCGFFTLQDAREARDRLRERQIRSEIVIRDVPGEEPNGPAAEEYWIRIDHARFREAATLLGEEPAAAAAEEQFDCGECGKSVGAEESFCAHCGARFEDD